MIISEKQIMQLIGIAREAVQLTEGRNAHWDKWSDMVADLLDVINNQQSEELKVIE